MLNVATESAASAPIPPLETVEPTVTDTRYADYKIIRRNGAVVGFAPNKIAIAVTKAFIAVQGGQAAASARIRELVESITSQVTQALLRRTPNGGTFHIEDIQDQVELALMRSGEHEVARSYVLYREKRTQERAAQKAAGVPEATLHVIEDGQKKPLDTARLATLLGDACAGLGDGVRAEPIMHTVLRDLYDGVPMAEVEKALVLAARSMIEQDPAYWFVTARLLLNSIRHEVLGEAVLQADMAARYLDYFPAFIKKGIDAELLDEKLAQFDLARLAKALDAGRDYQFGYLGLQTLYDRYFLHIEESRIELPQAFFMRVAMGLALNEIDREARAIEFYQVLSSFDFMTSTPTLFNSGTRRSQLSSCYLTTVADDLDGIYEAIKENALLAEIRRRPGQRLDPGARPGRAHQGHQRQVAGRGSVPEGGERHRRGGQPGRKAQGRGVRLSRNLAPGHRRIPRAAQEHRRRPPPHPRHEHGELDSGSVHEAGDGRRRLDAVLALRRARPARQVRQRIREGLYRLRGQGRQGRAQAVQEIPAAQLWRKMLSMLFETGHPWITFKDPCNIRSPQQHVGVVHSSNLCTEITLNTSDTEIAVCNLGSVNLVNHLKNGALDQDKLKPTIHTAMRMLDNVIDINYYAVGKARNSNLKHRPVGLGIMGFQDALHELRISYASDAAVEFADRSMEAVSYYAIWASTELAEERGRYSSYEAACGAAAFCRRTRSSCWARSAAAIWKWTAPARWTGTACVRASASTACATPTALRSRRPRPSPTSSACPLRSSRLTRTST